MIAPRAPLRALHRRRSGAAALLLTTAPALLGAQVFPPPSPATERVTVTPGAAYAASSAHRGLLGAGYRDLWTTPIDVPVVDLDRIGGGLVPVRIGGGVSTRTLHLDGADGRRYVFRSVHKTPRELLDDFEGTALEGIIQDQMAAFHPTGAPVVAHLLRAVGVLHTEPVFMVVPDDPRLGAFRSDFAGMLVLVEERPADGPAGGTGFAGSRRIVQTDELFALLEEEPAHQVDAEDYLRSRLIDLLVGDRDRSHNNHLWASFAGDDGWTHWRVIPRDRDQAFVRFDGAFMRLARLYERRFVAFDDAYPNVLGLTRNAWDMDRAFLTRLSRDAWARTVTEVQRALDDETLAQAVARMPPEHTAVIGDELRAALTSRRDHLGRAADVLYEIVFRAPDVHATDRREAANVTRRPDGGVELRLVAIRSELETFRRTFAPGETDEVRVYLHGGDDRIVLAGDGPASVRVRVIGGGGQDHFEDRTARGAAGFDLYDAGDGTSFPERTEATLHRHGAPRPYAWWFDTHRTVDWGSRTVPSWRAGYDPDRGLLLAAGVRHERYRFLARPYGSRTTARAGWALGRGRPIVELDHRRRGTLAGTEIGVALRYSGAELLNFYGYGNESAPSGPRAFHRVVHREASASVTVGIGGERRGLRVGPRVTYMETDTVGAATLVAARQPYGTGAFTQLGLEAGFDLDARDARAAPRRGAHAWGRASIHPALLGATGAFGRVEGQVAGYVPLGETGPVVAVRVAGARAFGRYPLAEAAALGGPTTLRGAREQRWIGDASALGSLEVRVPVKRLRFPLRGDLGVLALGDVGRVWLTGESSTRWHSAVGGGVWFALPDRIGSARVTVAATDGALRPSAGLGFAF